jgi:hypothetical protein
VPYDIAITLFDIAGVFGGTVPTVTGTLTGRFPGTPTRLAPDVGVRIPGAPTSSIRFPAMLSGALPASVVLSDTGATGGQLFRSGEVTLPPQPGPLTLYTATGSIPDTAVTAFGASLGGTQLSTPVDDWVKGLLGLFLGFGPPAAVTITSATVRPATGSLSITVTGTATYRLFFFVPFTQSFTIRTAVTIAPSGDGMRTDRIVSVAAAGTTLTLAIPTALPSPLAIGFPIPFDVFNGTLVAALEPVINRAIIGAVDAALRARTPPMRRTPTCVISARTVRIATSGISAQIMLADFGPAVVAPPRALALSVTPAPEQGVERTYTFRVVDRADQSPVSGATVALTNRSPASTQTRLTDAQGRATFTVTLRTQRLGGGPDGEPRLLHPFAVATAPGAQPATLVLTLIELA